jgi:hypothetical protein
LDVVTGSSGAIFRFDSASTWLHILPEDASGVVALCYRTNSGSAPDLVFRNDAGTETGRLTNDGKLLVGTINAPAGAPAGSVTAKGGVYLQSPDGTWFAVGVSDSGQLSATQVALAKHDVSSQDSDKTR